MVNLITLEYRSVTLLQPTHHLLTVPDLPVQPLHLVVHVSLELDRIDVLGPWTLKSPIFLLVGLRKADTARESRAHVKPENARKSLKGNKDHFKPISKQPRALNRSTDNFLKPRARRDIY